MLESRGYKIHNTSYTKQKCWCWNRIYCTFEAVKRFDVQKKKGIHFEWHVIFCFCNIHWHLAWTNCEVRGDIGAAGTIICEASKTLGRVSWSRRGTVRRGYHFAIKELLLCCLTPCYLQHITDRTPIGLHTACVPFVMYRNSQLTINQSPLIHHISPT